MVTQKRTTQQFEIPNRTLYRKDRIFLSYGHPQHDVGWKLHVVKPSGLSVLNLTLPESYKRLLIFLIEEKIPHKIVGSLHGIAYMEINPQQAGKFITIYPGGADELVALPDKIRSCIGSDAVGNACARNDRPVAAGVSARWGGLTGPYTVNQHNSVVEDDRARPHPDWIRDPFDQHSQGADIWTKISADRIQIRQQHLAFKELSGELSPKAMLLQEME